MHEIGKGMILLGAVLVIAGALFLFAPKIPFIGRLPGDLVFKGKQTTVYLPLATSIVISIALSVLLYLINRFR